MLPLLIADQIREADAYTIANEPISSVNLMERASKAFVSWFINHFPDKKQSISVYCGTGNNGGDGLAIARLLNEYSYQNLNVKVIRFSERATEEFEINLSRIKHMQMPLREISKGESYEEDSSIIIDGMLGNGLNKPLSGDYKALVNYLNRLKKTVVAVDIPTGFLADGEINKDAVVLKADLVITFQQPKINFLLPESAPHINCFETVNIGIDGQIIRSLNSPYRLVELKDIKTKLKRRHNFSNKGTYGHALIIAGQPETMGAALLCSAACAYTGAGLTTACIPQSGLIALNSYMPELMAEIRNGADLESMQLDKFNALAIGPGLGTHDESLDLVKYVLENYKKPMVVDADALNLVAKNKDLLKQLPAGSIITPHMKEFDRLFGEHSGWWSRIQTCMVKAKEFNICILLKNDYTIIATPEGVVYFNSTSNAAMATGGMGDVLTGIIVSLLAQKYSPEDACIIGAYIHGKAGDELALPNRMNVVLPGKLAAQLPVTMAKLLA